MRNSNAVKSVHYVSPVAVFLFFVLSRLFGKFYITSLKKTVVRKNHHAVTLKYLALGVLSIYTAQTISDAVNAIKNNDSAQDEIIHVVTSILIWAWIGTEDSLPWYTYAGCAFTTALFDIVLLALTITIPVKFIFHVIELALELSQIAICGCMIVLALISSIRKDHKLDDETEPLLPSTTSTPIVDNEGHAAQAKEDEDEEDQWGDSTKWNSMLRDRMIADSASWWDYLKAYKMFLPYLIPKKEPRLQFFLAIFIACLSVQRVLNVLIPRQLGIITDQLSKNSNNSTQTAPFAALWIYLFLEHFPLGLIKNVVRYPLTLFTYKRINCAAFDQVMSLDVDFHDNEDHSQIYSAISQGSAIQELLIVFVETILPSSIDLLVAFWYLGQLFDLYVSYTIFLAAGCYIFCKRAATNWTRPLRRDYIKKSRYESQVMFEAVSSWRNVVYFNRFDYESDRYKSAVDDSMDKRIKYAYRRSLASSFVDLIVALAFGVVSTLVIMLISQQEAPVGSFVTLITYWSRLWGPIERLSESYQQINDLLIDAERLLWLFQIKPVVIESPTATDLVITNASVEYENVDFSYDPRKETVQDIGFHAAGGTTAFVGVTGGGKSTIFKLLYRLYDVTNGSIKIDGQDIRDVTLNSLRNTIGMVPQDPFLFNASLMKNVRYGRLDATDEEIFAACRAASIHDKILSFPDGYESIVGQRGVKLSGGELQRIAIARCLLKNPKILLLDEASSSVDSETEAQIQNALAKLTTGRTTFVIAHRLSTIANADRINVIDGGRIIESGTHEELLQRGTRYHKLWTLQRTGFLGDDFTEQEEPTLLDTPIEDGTGAGSRPMDHLNELKEVFAIENGTKECQEVNLSDVEEGVENENESVGSEHQEQHTRGDIVKAEIIPIESLTPAMTPEPHNLDGGFIDDQKQTKSKGKEKALTQGIVQYSAPEVLEQSTTEQAEKPANTEEKSKRKGRSQRRKRSQSDSTHVAVSQTLDLSGAADTQTSSGTNAQSSQHGPIPTTQKGRGSRGGHSNQRGLRRRGANQKARSESEAESSSAAAKPNSTVSLGEQSIAESAGSSKTNPGEKSDQVQGR